MKFFVHLNGKNRFSYNEYLEAYESHQYELRNKNTDVPQFMSVPEDFLQFLYELNILCYIERTVYDDVFIHWCFKDRTYSNISPKIKLKKDYEIFYGMSKALNTGRRFQ